MKNPRSALLLAALCLFALTALAQPYAGLKGGANYTSLSGYTGDHRVNFHAGIFVHVSLNRNWSVQPELLYSGEGQHFVIPGNGEDHGEMQGLISLDYAVLPVMLRYNPGSRFYLEAGPQLSVLVAAHSRGTGTDDMNRKRSFSNGQLALGLGAGFAINQRIGIYGRYNFGMTDITPNSSDATNTSGVQLGITFRSGKQKPTHDMPEK
ncbi:MAG TPA: porin family protein [Chitinophagaceae bacterium]|jgi:hypothetical protein|nr:porin family protein [Chitinophagaceae bacterium]